MTHHRLIAMTICVCFTLLATPVRAFHNNDQGHNGINKRALAAFLKPTVFADIDDESQFVDITYQFSSKYHFDGCLFQESAANINAHFQRAVTALNPDSPDLEDAPDAFGQLLHVVQDFYSHANWIELGRFGLIEDGYGYWNPLTERSEYKGLIIIQGEDSDFSAAGLTLSRPTGSAIVTVKDAKGNSKQGLLTGSITYEPDDCPDSVGLGHWDWQELDGDKGLNKDDDTRGPGYHAAYARAIDQTEHEWCRLVNLVKTAYGRKGVQFLFDNWVADTDRALAACPSADIAFVIDTTGSMGDDIDAVKKDLADIIADLNKKPTIVRLALATFRDHPVNPYGEPGDYPFKANKNFTLGDDISEAINDLGVDGGGDIPEAVYSGLMGAMDGALGGWNGNATKRSIILMGDAPAHDPEPITGYTLGAVIAKAASISVTLPPLLAAEASGVSVQVHSVLIGNRTDAAQSFGQIASGTGGSVFTAATADNVVEAVLDAIDETLSPTYRIFAPLLASQTAPSCTAESPRESTNISDAVLICSAQTVDGQVGNGDLDDVYSVFVAENQSLRLTLSGSGPGDADLYLFAPVATDVNVDAPAAASVSDGNSESIAGTAKLGGYWYIDIYSFDDGLVNYRLKVEVSDVTGATDPITLGDAPSGQNPGKQLEH